MTPARRERGRRRDGRTVLEVALVLNVVLMIILGVFEYGRIVMLKQLMDNAAREGARTAIVSTNTYPPTTTATIQAEVTSYLVGQSVQNLTIQVYQADITTGANLSNTWTSAAFGSDIAVQVDADYQPMIPTTFGILPSPLHLTSKCVMRSEAN